MRASEYPNQLQITYRRLLISMAALEKAVQQTQSQERVLNSHVACELNGRHLAHSSHSKALISPDAQANSPLIHPPPETPPAPPSPVKGAACLALGTGRARLAVYLSMHRAIVFRGLLALTPALSQRAREQENNARFMKHYF